MAAGSLSPTIAARASAERAGRVLLAVLAFGLFSPALALPLHDDDFFTLYWARASTLDPRWLFHDWYDGVLGRFVGKLLVMLGMSTVGTRHEAYELVNLLLHVVNVLLVERLARAWTGSRRAAFLTALLFAVGFGFYGRAVMKISNLAMNVGETLTLCAFAQWQAGRRWRALLLWLVTLGTHEITAFAPLVMPFTPVAGATVKPASERWRTGLALSGLVILVLALPLRGSIGQTAASLLSYPGIALLPLSVRPARELQAAGLGIPLGLVGFLVEHRLAVGLALLPAAAFSLTRGPAPRLAVVWMLLSWLPTAVFMSTRTEGWFDLRHLMAPAVGLCLLVAVALDRLASRRVRGLLLAGFVAWSLLLLSMVWLITWQRIERGPRWSQQQREFVRDLAQLERTHVPIGRPAGPALRPDSPEGIAPGRR
jgi:hypothetical protein